MSEETVTQTETMVEAVTSVVDSPESTPNPAPTDSPQTVNGHGTDSAATDADSAESSSAKKSGRRRRKRKIITDIPYEVGDKLDGKVKSITDFGAFVDVKLPRDGLLHVSELSRERVEKVDDVLSIGDDVTVWVKNIDKERGRIGLTMIKPVQRRYAEIKEEDVLEGLVTRIENYGVFVDVGLPREGLVHISELAHDYIKTPEDVVKVGEQVQVKVLKVNSKKRQVDLSIKALIEPPESEDAEDSYAPQYDESEEDELEVGMDDEVTTTMGAAFEMFQSMKQPSRKKMAKRQHRRGHMNDAVYRTLKSQR
jgi:ribosomal protein S1